MHTRNGHLLREEAILHIKNRQLGQEMAILRAENGLLLPEIGIFYIENTHLLQEACVCYIHYAHLLAEEGISHDTNRHLLREVRISDARVGHLLHEESILFEFYEDSLQYGSGIFKGEFTCDWAFKDGYEGISLSQSYFPGNSFEFIGDWINYKTNKSKKCCWSDSMSPCVPDDFYFTDGAGYFVSDQYKKNGWENFSEYFKDNNEWWK